MGVSMATAELWVDRWERQQRRYAIQREERFAVLADVAEYATRGVSRPLLVDLGCGPGSLAARVARRVPRAELVAVDRDPLLLELARTHHADAARYVEAVLGADGWVEELGLTRAPDAVLSATALHCLSAATLARTYRQVAAVLRPGGVLVNADHFPEDTPEGDPAGSALAAHLGRSRLAATLRGDEPDWESWWRGVAGDPELADLCAERARRPAGEEGPDNGLSFAAHARLLRAAGFRAVSTVWQYGESRVLVAFC
ncbi:class I SAM-dependent methyltransferase [Streptomyces sp. DSM 44915]|uniref:Class I SAM-dependent methyltransferase n=1 Tax=Streptomyces chisholmiae TaxID=3075540 RepID=A0ABU2JU56_9ACTN|nr:class I SAM-dependent methyltransferase [Streptomyces sp. DSM 44915]MDT0268525.1 class I SAM-dependent methyltransferase [Streptomyces sp. DSM 44915]